MPWWVWMLLGLALLLHEVTTTGAFVSLFFGAGAIFVGVLATFNAAGPLWLQLLLFTSSSVVSLVILRRKLLAKFRPPERIDLDSVIGSVAIALEPIATGAIGKTELRGSVWNAHNAGARSIGIAERCSVIGIDGLLLQITIDGRVGVKEKELEEDPWER